MEETLIDCLVRVKEDLNQLKKVRDYLDKNAETEEPCSFSWRTIEVFNSILSVCTSQNAPETSALDTLLDSFYYLARNNANTSVWDNFGFELGIICVKLLSAIERTDIFEVLFSKLLSVITIVCKHNPVIWKAAARQILNVLINKKFSMNYLEGILKSYICMIKNVKSFVLHEFSTQNLGLLKTISFLVQKLGDFEIQSNIVEIIFLHMSKNTKLMTDFFTTTENQFFQSLRFGDFEGDCRLFLNALNKSRKELERKVYSVGCRVLYVGGCFVEPPLDRNCIWVDANKDTNRLSIRCGDVTSNENRVIYVQFSEVIDVHLENDDTTGGSRYLIIRTKSLREKHEEFSNNDISLEIESADGVLEFVNFLETVIREKIRKGQRRKASKTVDCLFIDVGSSKEVQYSAITSSDKTGFDPVLPKVFSSATEVNRSTLDFEMQHKTSQSLKEICSQASTPALRAFKTQFTVLGSQEVSPNSFVESLNKHMGLDSPEPKHTFEDSIRTVEFLQKDTPEKIHKLFKSTDENFNSFQAKEYENFTFIFDDNKENNPFVEAVQPEIKTRKQKLRMRTTSNHNIISLCSQTSRTLRNKKRTDTNVRSPQSQDYFQGNLNVVGKKKPRLPKLKRTKKAVNEEFVTKEINKKNNLGLKARTRRKGFLQNDAATEPNANPQKIRLRSRKLEIPALSMQQMKFKEKVELKEEEPCGQRKNIKEDHNASDKGKGEEAAGKKASAKEWDLQHSGMEEDKKKKKKKEEEKQGKPESPICQSRKKTPEITADAKPSLLDPNGYAYKRWCRPTTSERSNFWLKKLKVVEKPKADFNIFEFSEEFDTNCSKSLKKRKTAHFRLSNKEGKTKRKSLQQTRLLSRPPQNRETSTENPREESSEEEEEEHPGSPDPRRGSPQEEEFSKINSFSSDRETAVDAANEDSEHESVSGEDEAGELQKKKREHSDEKGSSAGTYTKKKPKTALPRVVFFSFLRRRLQRAEERDRRQTDQIIQIVNDAVDRLLDHLHVKNGEKTGSYLKAAEAASEAADAEILALDLRAKRIRRAILYFEAAHSVSDSCETLEEHFSRARESAKVSTGGRSASEALDRIGHRLGGLIRSAAEGAIESEWTARRDLLCKCACLGD